MSKDNGGNAFPSPCRSVADEMVNLEYRGMTLRDYFAAKAMQSIILSPHTKDEGVAVQAICSYEIADAMLKERAK